MFKICKGVVEAMSYILEAILVPAVTTLRTEIDVSSSDLLDIVPLGDSSQILVRRGRVVFDAWMDRLAIDQSRVHKEALLVRWDDRIGSRESKLFRHGELFRTYSSEHELYARVDASGDAILSDSLYRESELETMERGGDEFELVKNAIQLGCEQTTFVDWNTLQKFIHGNC